MQVPVMGQSISPLDNDRYRARVKLVDEFRERFNLHTQQSSLSDCREDSLADNILLLCDLASMKSKNDSAFILAKNFARTAVRQHTKLQYADSTWVAKAHCHARYKGKATEFTLFLNVQERGKGMYKWVIARAEGELLMLPPSQRHDRIMLLPDDHETQFMSLRNMTSHQPDCVVNFASGHVRIDPTSVFFALAYGGDLQIEYVSPLEFIFLQVPGYIFSLRHFERESKNAGWLIDTITPATKEQKDNFLQTIYDHD